jgi:hypothetical protein
MDTDIVRLPAFEASPSRWAHLVGTCVGIFGVVIIVAGILWSTHLRLNGRTSVHPFDEYKMRVRWPWRRELLPVRVAVTQTRKSP